MKKITHVSKEKNRMTAIVEARHLQKTYRKIGYFSVSPEGSLRSMSVRRGAAPGHDFGEEEGKTYEQ